MNEDNLKRALDKIDIQIEATIAVLSGGRSMNGNSFDFNNLMETKKHIESLLAANATKTSKK